ncbi:MAG: hypothetical protein KGL39_27690 [Patescibacteria group bacterium]|nr:hypothetical protein [Patescibacteria group bacterium]
MNRRLALLTLKYLLAPEVCEEAARKGRLDVLKWARANGCGSVQGLFGICYAAWANYQQEVLQWLRENGCTCSVCSSR